MSSRLCWLTSRDHLLPAACKLKDFTWLSNGPPGSAKHAAVRVCHDQPLSGADAAVGAGLQLRSSWCGLPPESQPASWLLQGRSRDNRACHMLLKPELVLQRPFWLSNCAACHMSSCLHAEDRPALAYAGWPSGRLRATLHMLPGFVNKRPKVHQLA